MKQDPEVQSLLNSLLVGNITEKFQSSNAEERYCIFMSLVNSYRLLEDPLYLDLIENLFEQVYSQRSIGNHKFNSKPIHLIEEDKSQVRSGLFGYSLLCIFDVTRNKKYLDAANLDMASVLSPEIKTTKTQKHICFKESGSEVYAENAWFIYPFWIKYSILQNDILLMSKGLNQYLSLLHELHDESTGLYHSMYKENIFGSGISKLPYYSCISNSLILTSFSEILSNLKESVGNREIKGKVNVIEKLSQNLAENLAKVSNSEGLFPYTLVNIEMEKLGNKALKHVEVLDITDSLLISASIIKLARLGVLNLDDYAFANTLIKNLPRLFVSDPETNQKMIRIYPNSCKLFYEYPNNANQMMALNNYIMLKRTLLMQSKN